MDEVELAYRLDQVSIHSEIKVQMVTWYDDKQNCLPEAEDRIIETTVGRVLFNRILPPEVQFVNTELDKGGVKDLIAECLRTLRSGSDHGCCRRDQRHWL